MKRFAYILIVSVLLISFQTPRKIKVWMIGDSTMANKEVKAYPETGWGMPFAYFFDSTVTIENRAKNGRSTRTFISENLWKPVADNISEGDYVFIQFGHNDESKEKTDRYTSPADYKKNLMMFITETRNRKGIPVLLTPVSRRYFDSSGRIKETHIIYSALAREVAAEMKVAVIDLDAKSRGMLQKFGPENSKLLFMQLERNEHPNYPDGRNDNTHFNELGARKMAQLVLEEIKSLHLDLANHIRQPLVVKK